MVKINTRGRSVGPKFRLMPAPEPVSICGHTGRQVILRRAGGTVAAVHEADEADEAGEARAQFLDMICRPVLGVQSAVTIQPCERVNRGVEVIYPMYEVSWGLNVGGWHEGMDSVLLQHFHHPFPRVRRQPSEPSQFPGSPRVLEGQHLWFRIACEPLRACWRRAQVVSGWRGPEVRHRATICSNPRAGAMPHGVSAGAAATP